MTINNKNVGPKILQPQSGNYAWVVFSNHTDLKWLKMFKRNFRHCFVVWHDGRHWLSFDPLSNHSEINVHYEIKPEHDFIAWLRAQSLQTIKTEINHNHRKVAPWGLFTCVEAVKRFLGVHKRFIFTPWQLYRHLQK